MSERCCANGGSVVSAPSTSENHSKESLTSLFLLQTNFQFYYFFLIHQLIVTDPDISEVVPLSQVLRQRIQNRTSCGFLTAEFLDDKNTAPQVAVNVSKSVGSKSNSEVGTKNSHTYDLPAYIYYKVVHLALVRFFRCKIIQVKVSQLVSAVAKVVVTNPPSICGKLVFCRWERKEREEEEEKEEKERSWQWLGEPW